jgi:hypothetical protein
VGNKITPCHPRRMTWHSKMTWPMTWLPSGTPSSPVWPVKHPVWPRLALRLAPSGPIWPPSGPPSGPSSAPISSLDLERCTCSNSTSRRMGTLERIEVGPSCGIRCFLYLHSTSPDFGFWVRLAIVRSYRPPADMIPDMESLSRLSCRSVPRIIPGFRLAPR